ncbi:MAG: arylsulfatase [Paludibacter sp.]|nr:arylsulfatase [Paludibacter sp.]
MIIKHIFEKIALGGMIPSAMLLTTMPPTIAQTQKPNVIYILGDDLGIGELSCYGETKLSTPNIDRLAIEGMKFMNHYSGNTVSSPSRAVLMTGLNPGVCYIRGNMENEFDCSLEPSMVVLPEVFKAAGYTTGAFGKWGLGITNHKGKENPLNNGFDCFTGPGSQTAAHNYFPSYIVRNGKKLKLKKNTYSLDTIMSDAFTFIRKNAKAKKPFFCYIPTMIPHAGMMAPPALHEKWRKVFPQFDNEVSNFGGRTVVNTVAGFAAMMEYLDSNVGTILNLLKEYGIDKNTMIIFSSDNGAHSAGNHLIEFWNSTAGLRGKKRDLYEGGIKAPMLVRWLGVVPPGSTTDHISAFWDVLPTICELIKQPIPEQNTGISFLETIKGQQANQKKHDFLFFEFAIDKNGKQNVKSQAVRMNNWKAVKLGKESIELYDLSKDPTEKNNVAAENPAIVTKMECIIKESHTPTKDDSPNMKKKKKKILLTNKITDFEL